jgi:hypothetical protein
MSFFEWMMQQIGRDDPVGDLADDMRLDTVLEKDDMALIDMSPEYWQSRIKSETTNSQVLMALYGAIAEYREVN